MNKPAALPSIIALDDTLFLRHFTEADAPALARAVGESLEHLRPWMPWAGEESADPAFQRERLRKLADQAARREEWQYGLFSAERDEVLGSFGLMTRRGPGTIEIGYWLHVAATGHGYATRAVSALTEVAEAMPDVHDVLIYCDEANHRSAAIAERLGYRLVRTEKSAPEASAETDQTLVYARASEPPPGPETAAERRA